MLRPLRMEVSPIAITKPKQHYLCRTNSLTALLYWYSTVLFDGWSCGRERSATVYVRALLGRLPYPMGILRKGIRELGSWGNWELEDRDLNLMIDWFLPFWYLSILVTSLSPSLDLQYNIEVDHLPAGFYLEVSSLIHISLLSIQDQQPRSQPVVL